MVRVSDDERDKYGEEGETNYVRLAGNGLPGGEQQAACSSGVAAAPTSDGSPGRSNQLALPSSSGVATTSSSQWALPLDENDHRYVGLVNQAMTCYLNSLVQSLYMTPEFRNAMYEWEYVQHPAHIKEQKKKAEQSIPCQLQKLFLLLQTTDNDSLETKDLTQSFGWTSNEAYDQHDVQELCRLMFDALEHKWKGTKHEKLIQDLYRGTLEDFVACLNCGRESVKTDYFLDLSLAVKPFGAIHAYKSVEEALNAFVQPELLNGSNQYSCENCKSSQDAHKGLRITQFPYLFTIQLKRFDFDYNTMHRIKLNDKMSFPDVLDLNEYVNKEKRPVPPTPPAPASSTTSPPPSAWKPIPGKEENEEDDMELGSPNAKRFSTPGNTSPNRYSFRGDEYAVVGHPIDHEAVEDLIKTNGDNVYELFSVMVHSGNAAGGHYFAYIKNLDQDRWYVFNDTRVDFATPQEVEKSFGGHSSGWNQSNTNAYMLMYRKIDRKRNASFILSNKLPQHIKDSQEKWKRLEREAEAERLRKLSLIQVYVTINYPFPSFASLPGKEQLDLTPQKYQIADDFCEYKIEISREMPIRNVFNHAFEFFCERARAYSLPFAKNNARLIFVEHNHLKEDYRSPKDLEKKLRSVFNTRHGEPGSMFGVHFILDVRIASSFFAIDVPNQMTIKVQRVDVGKRTTANELTIVVPAEEKMLKVKQWIGAQFRDDIRAVLDARVVLEAASSRCEFMLIDTQHNGRDFRSLISQHMGHATPTLYYDGGVNTMITEESKEATLADRKLQFEKSQMYKILDRKCFSTFVKVRLPSQEEVEKAASTVGAYQGLSWVETVAIMKEEDKLWNEPRVAAVEVMSTVSKNESVDTALVTEGDDEPIPSGRVSTASMRSISMDDIDADIGISGSLCNNTPQMSPCVSEGDDSDDKELAGKHQLMADYMQKTSPEFYYNRDPQSHSNKNLRIGFAEDTPSEALSAVSSGQSTLVPSTSNQALSSMARSTDEAIDSKITTVFTHDNFHKLDVDSRMKVVEFKRWVAEQLKMDKDQFVIVKHASDDGSDTGYESSFTDEDTVSSGFQSCFISIKLRAPLKQDERMIAIVLFDMLDNNKDNWKQLFELPACESTLAGDLLLHAIRMYNDIYQEQLVPKMVRLREMNSSGSSSIKAVLNPNEPLSKRTYSWYNQIYMQIITDDSIVGKPGDPILVRRFRPSTVEVSPTHEVLMDSNAENPVLSFMQAVSKTSGIPVERLAVSDPKEFTWLKWPYMKSRLDMLDPTRNFFTKDLYLSYPHPLEFVEKVGGRVLYYKDSEEEAKILTEEERKQIKIKENGQSASANRRKERPLRIQMSSVCEG